MEPPVRAASPGFQAHGSSALGWWISTLLREPVASRLTAPRHGLDTAQKTSWAKSKMRLKASAAGLIPPALS